jgi:hypothetical protein
MNALLGTHYMVQESLLLPPFSECSRQGSVFSLVRGAAAQLLQEFVALNSS